MSAADIAVAAALSQVGVPYGWGKEQKGIAFDCSGLVQWSYAQAGISLPRVTEEQISSGTAISSSDRSQWGIGDLIFPDIGHVQMYLGNGQIVESPETGQLVHVVNEWANTIVAVRRVAGSPGSGTTNATNTSDTVQEDSATSSLSNGWGAAEKFFGDLTNFAWWYRIGCMLAGAGLITFGIIMLNGGTLDTVKGALSGVEHP